MVDRNLAQSTTIRAIQKAVVPHYEGLKIFGGRVNTQDTGNKTYEFAYELDARGPKQVGSVRAIMCQSRAAASPGPIAGFVDLKYIGALADLDSAWGGTTALFSRGLAGAASIPAPGTTDRRNFAFTDQTKIIPVARTDGGTKPLIAARTFLGSGGSAFLGTSGDSFANWSTRPTGLARQRVNSAVGDARASTTGWSATSTGPVIGFSYNHLGPIINVVSIGDSITEGRSTTTFLGENFTLLACESINAGTQATWVSHSNLGWSGQNTAQILVNTRDMLRSGIIPDVLVFPSGSPNDVTTTITTAIVDGWRAYVADMLALCAEYRIVPVIWTMLPVNYAVKAFGSTDTLRIAYVAEIVALVTSTGLIVVNMEPVFAGPVDGNGQTTLLYSDDGIHPNATGNANGMVPMRDQGIKQAMIGSL